MSYPNIFNFVCFDGEEGVLTNNDPGYEEKKFAQKDVDSFLAKERRKTKEAQAQLLSQLEEVKKTSKMNNDERSALEGKIEELQKLTMTAEERSRQKEGKLQKQYDEKLTTLETERESWKRRHTDLLVSNSILRAASTNKAVEPVQLLKMLKGDVRVVQKFDENGQLIDDFDIRMNFPDTNKDGKPIELDLTIDEAVKRMTELPQYGNLFEGGKAGGVGGNNMHGKSAGKIDVARLARENPAKYRELRKSNPAAIFGS
jgi:hypothetical protein